MSWLNVFFHAIVTINFVVNKKCRRLIISVTFGHIKFSLFLQTHVTAYFHRIKIFTFTFWTRHFFSHFFSQARKMEMMLTMCFCIQSRIEAYWTVNLRINIILALDNILWGWQLWDLPFSWYSFPFEFIIFLVTMLMMITLLCWVCIPVFFYWIFYK